jgi:high-affinity iron transporter
LLQAFIITLREGLEAFLVIAITLAYLRRRGSFDLIPAVYWGIAGAVLVSGTAWMLFARAQNQALWEGILALVAAGLVATLTVHMWRVARTIKRDIEQRIESSAQKTGWVAFAGVFLFTVFMISREGIEMALLMNTILFQIGSFSLLTGAIAGLLLAAGVAWVWTRYDHRINLGLFFQVTAVFLLVFVVQLVIYGVHELSEANVFPGSQAVHWATEPYGPDGLYGRWLTFGLVLLPMAWLAFAALWPQRSRGGATAA